jgi:microcystin-dependent protein
MQPTLALNYIIATIGMFPSDSGSLTDDSPYLGQIALFSGTFAPDGWAFAQGQILPITGNNALYALLGTTYGGNGSVTFGLPDLRGRLPIGVGQGPGLTPWLLGDWGGADDINLFQSNMPAHVHTVPEPAGMAMLLAAAAIGAACRKRAAIGRRRLFPNAA